MTYYDDGDNDNNVDALRSKKLNNCLVLLAHAFNIIKIVKGRDS